MRKIMGLAFAAARLVPANARGAALLSDPVPAASARSWASLALQLPFCF
jgi:hypothetical protein